ncbi:CTP synthase [Frankia sp. AgKG'84/4]|uniref:CTP synthase n=1 Tax=Frankia sp. AgKG'84/4 TaxID=573490 RepID=UPI00200CBF08|nr:CTP synthase [Frankia sp. AgKG'84/4]MCL9794331.1 CTP synthase [Frankia sp. AgKG'84/4]
MGQAHVTKHIFVTGGVASSLGKGLTASSLGRLLKARGLRVTMQKLDPYLNVDPGTMNPFQHGEVFVTDDGAETDLDIGHYERFLDVNLDGSANVTTGQVYSAVIARERRGDYLGQTVQVVPHITDEIKDRIRRLANDSVDVVITEVGGTVGDIESLPYLEAIRQVRHEVGRDNALTVHVSLVPYLAPSGELKTKPTQHSVAALRSIGLQPDAVVCRSDRPLPESLKKKIAMMCDVDDEAVVGAPDASSIYDIPRVLHREGLDAYVVRRLGLSFRDVDWTEWDLLLRRVHQPANTATIGIVGKYVDLPDAYLSVTEALRAGAFATDTRVELRWITSDECDSPQRAAALLEGVDGIIVPGGFGVRGIEGKLSALRHARENAIPTLGICLGLQCMVIEAARHVAGLPGANSTEFEAQTPHPVISTMADQHEVVAGTRDMGGTMRLGLYTCVLSAGSVARGAYGVPEVAERHRHRYEVNNDYRDRLSAAGLVFSGTSPDGRLVEVVELPADVHPYYVGTQAHPEFRSRPTRAHPLFRGLVAAALVHADRRRGVLPVELRPEDTLPGDDTPSGAPGGSGAGANGSVSQGATAPTTELAAEENAGSQPGGPTGPGRVAARRASGAGTGRAGSAATANGTGALVAK